MEEEIDRSEKRKIELKKEGLNWDEEEEGEKEIEQKKRRRRGKREVKRGREGKDRGGERRRV